MSKKSKLIPSKRCKFFGLIFDSQKMSVELSKKKQDKVVKFLNIKR